MKLKDYIQGKRHGKEANRLEREALNDPFLQDALDGFNTVGGNHLDAIGRLEKELGKRIKSNEKSNDNYLWLVGIAASITLLIGFGSLFFIQNKSDFVAAIDTTVINQQNEPEYLSEQTGQDTLELSPAVNPSPVAKAPIIAKVKIEESAKIMDFTADKEIVEDISFAAEQKSGSRTITGTVADKDGPIPMANVMVKGTTKGVAADFDGKYSIDVNEGETLAFSSSGSVTQERKITGKSPNEINVSLKEDVKELDEFVVVGYGVQKKSDLTGAVSPIREEKLKESVATSIDQAMQGRVAGVQVTKSSGQPGAAASVRIRGLSSLSGNNEPLYVVDGIPISQGKEVGANPLDSINPADIVSMEVLKESSATAIYGSRAVNGVVLITTSKGKKAVESVKFGKKEFKEYFEKNRSENICYDEKASVEVHFYIDETGNPINFEIKKSNCDELQEELIELLENGPKWSSKKRNVKLDIQLK